MCKISYIAVELSEKALSEKLNLDKMKYKRILLKLSGESLMGAQGYGIDSVRLGEYAEQIKAIAQAGTEVAIVIGGGNRTVWSTTPIRGNTSVTAGKRSRQASVTRG